MKKLTSILLVLSLCTSLYGCSRMGTNIYNGLNNKRLETKSTGLDNTCINWFFIPNNESRTPDVNDKLNFKLSDYDAIYNGPKSPNVKSLYLTFDEGYENGNTAKILDILKENNKLIGQAGLTMQNINIKINGSNELLEIGYLFNKNYWHKGFAIESAVSCKEYAFNKLNVDRVYSIIRDNNIPSQKVAIKNQMKIVGKITKHYYNMDMPHYVFCCEK
ncbi:GNAT family N-acetyltransferase [Brachyspira pilosicoli]